MYCNAPKCFNDIGCILDAFSGIFIMKDGYEMQDNALRSIKRLILHFLLFTY